MTIGRTIRYLRQSSGMSQAKLATNVGISAAYLSQLENDRREPSISLLRALAQELGAPSTILFASALATPDNNNVGVLANAALSKLTEAVGAILSQAQLLNDPKDE